MKQEIPHKTVTKATQKELFWMDTSSCLENEKA